MMSQAANILSGFYMRLFTLVHPMHCLDNLSYTGQMYFKCIFIAQSIPAGAPIHSLCDQAHNFRE